MIKANFELRREDLAALIKHHQAASPAIGRYRNIRLVVAFCALMILPAIVLFASDKPFLETAKAIWPLLAGPVLFGVLAIPYTRWRTQQITRHLLDEGKNNGFYGPCQIQADDDGITETRGSGASTRTWASVERIATTSTHLFVYTSGIEAFVIPRRAFAVDVEFLRFADTIAQYAGIKIQAGH